MIRIWLKKSLDHSLGSVLCYRSEMLAQSVHLGHAWPIMWRQKWKLTTHHRPKLHWLAPLLRLKVIHSVGKSVKKSHFTPLRAKRATVTLVKNGVHI